MSSIWLSLSKLVKESIAENLPGIFYFEEDIYG